jgi:benzoate/toluate 1,2-dioxygenase beta subunit
MSVDGPLRDRIEAFVNRESALLDAQRYEDWLALFAPDGYYWVPRRPAQASWRDEVSIFYDDRMLLETRVRRLAAAVAHAESPRTRTLRVLGRVEAQAGGGPGIDILATSSFVMLEYRLNAQRVYGGTFRHALRCAGEGFAIAWKRVDLVNADAVHEPISVPF